MTSHRSASARITDAFIAAFAFAAGAAILAPVLLVAVVPFAG